MIYKGDFTKDDLEKSYYWMEAPPQNQIGANILGSSMPGSMSYQPNFSGQARLQLPNFPITTQAVSFGQAPPLQQPIMYRPMPQQTTLAGTGMSAPKVQQPNLLTIRRGRESVTLR